MSGRAWFRDDAETAARMAAETIAAQQAALRAEDRLASLIAGAEEVLDELDDRADVTDGPDGTQRPDWVASLANTLRDALAAARR